MLPNPPRLLLEPGELVVLDPPEEGEERPTTVGVDDVPERPVVVVRVVVVSLPPPCHHQPDERYPPVPLLVRDPELQFSGCQRPLWGFCRQSAPLPCRNWQASMVG